MAFIVCQILRYRYSTVVRKMTTAAGRTVTKTNARWNTNFNRLSGLTEWLELNPRSTMVNRIHIFLFIYSFISLIGSVTLNYIVSAVQSIERHFQVPSKVSGFMISTSKFLSFTFAHESFFFCFFSSVLWHRNGSLF